MSMRPRLAAVIVNWNSGEDLRACVGALAASHRTWVDLRSVTVVDNGSTDRSTDALPAADLPLRVIRNPGNRGFAAACNQGAGGADADYLLFLNPDVQVTPDALDATMRALADPARAQVGVCGIQLLDEAGAVWRSCSRFPRARHFALKALMLDRVLPPAFARQEMREWDHACDRQVDQVIGAFFLVRAGVFRQLRGFDERFFVYFEEVDVCLRAAQAGWQTWYFAGALAHHRGGGSSSKDQSARLRLVLRSRIRYARKHYGVFGQACVLAVTLGLEPVSRLAQSLLGGSRMRPREIINAYAGLWRDLVTPHQP